MKPKVNWMGWSGDGFQFINICKQPQLRLKNFIARHWQCCDSNVSHPCRLLGPRRGALWRQTTAAWGEHLAKSTSAFLPSSNLIITFKPASTEPSIVGGLLSTTRVSHWVTKTTNARGVYFCALELKHQEPGTQVAYYRLTHFTPTCQILILHPRFTSVADIFFWKGMKSGSQRPNLREERFSCVISRVLPALEDSLRNAERLPRAWGPSVIVKVEHLKTAFCPPLPSSCNTTLHNEELITKQDPSGKKVIDCHHESSHDPHGPHQWHKVRQKAEAFCARPDKDPSSIQRGQASHAISL